MRFTEVQLFTVPLDSLQADNLGNRAGHFSHSQSCVLQTDLLPTAEELGIGILAYSPLGRGMLTGTFKSVDDLPEGDWRRTMPRFQQEAFMQVYCLTLTFISFGILWPLCLHRERVFPEAGCFGKDAFMQVQCTNAASFGRSAASLVPKEGFLQ